jgi:hypothetical protein
MRMDGPQVLSMAGSRGGVRHVSGQELSAEQLGPAAAGVWQIDR